MKTKEEVTSKFLALREKCLKERTRMYLEQKPINCCFSKKAKIGGSKCFVCLRPELTEVIDCDCTKCKSCGDFACKNTEEGVREEFGKILASPSRCFQEYPKLAMMIWFLQDAEPNVPRKKHLWNLFGGI